MTATFANGQEDRGRVVRRVALAAAIVLLLVLGGIIVRGRLVAQKPDPAANDTVLRTARLAGYTAARVGADRSSAVVELWLPSTFSAADAELAWQTGMAMLAQAYPTSPSYRVVLRTDNATRVSVSGKGRPVREAVEKDDPAALRQAASFALLPGAQNPGALVPSNAGGRTQGRESELDAANRAAGLSTPSGPDVTDAEELAAAWRRAQAEAPGVPAPSGGVESATQFAASRIEKALSGSSVEGADALNELVPGLVAAQDVATLRQWASAAEAVTSKTPMASVLGLTATAAREVEAAVEETGNAGAAASRPVAVTSLAREPSLDATASAVGTSFPALALARWGTSQAGRIGFAWRTAESTAPTGSSGTTMPVPAQQGGSATPSRWLAYRAPDGNVYWLAGTNGDVALTDTTLYGWGYQTPSAAIVSAADDARVLATFTSGGSQ